MIVEISNWIKKECGIYNLPYVDTTYNRENIINEFIENLCEQKKQNQLTAELACTNIERDGGNVD